MALASWPARQGQQRSLRRIGQSRLLELIEPIVNEAVPGVHGAIYIVGGLGYLAALGAGTRLILPGEAEDAWRAVGRVGGEVILGSRPTRWTSESRRPVRRRCGRRRPVQQSLPWLPCRQTKPTNCLRRR